MLGEHMSKWSKGYPNKLGWYRCLVDGEVEMDLKCYMCQVSRKMHWVDDNGDYIESMYNVEWGEPVEHGR